MMPILFDKLKARGKDAISKRDRDRIHQIIGQIEMAYELRQLTWSQQEELMDMMQKHLNELSGAKISEVIQ